MDKIYYAKPSVTQLEIDYVTDAITNGWGDHCADYIKKFEKKFRDYLGSKFSMATSSCTGALTIALAVLGIGSGDEVIVPELTWIATAAPIVHLGAEPVFVDVLQDTWCIDPKKIEEAITPKTKAIIVVHLYGNIAEMDEIQEIARKHNLYIIEDAAEGLGSEYHNKKAGSMGHFGVFSFHGTKTIATGEGGMLVTNDETLYNKARILADHGRNPNEKKMFWPEIIGYKFKMSNLQAAMGLAQIERIDNLIKRKREVFKQYKLDLGSVNGISFNPEKSGTKNSYWMTTILFDKHLQVDRNELLAQFKNHNIDIRPFFYPLSSLTFFKKNEKNMAAYDIAPRGINLPCYNDITNEQIKKVCLILSEFIGGKQWNTMK